MEQLSSNFMNIFYLTDNTLPRKESKINFATTANQSIQKSMRTRWIGQTLLGPGSVFKDHQMLESLWSSEALASDLTASCLSLWKM